MRIGFLCAHNPYDRNAFSGTAFYSCAALGRLRDEGLIGELRILGTHAPVGRRSRLIQRTRRMLTLPPQPLSFASLADRGDGLDWIVSMVSGGMALRLAPQLLAPFVHVTDATPDFLRDFYGRDIPPSAQQEETRVIEQAARVVYSSDFMRARALEEFGPQAGEKMRVVPFGVNLDHLPDTVTAGPAWPAGPGKGPLNLLFIGKDWQRKGGAIAFAAQQQLRVQGWDARLNIIGCDPPEAQGRPGVTIFPYLDKNLPEDARRFEALLADSHLFVLPTRADCTPMVIAEANAWSIPVLVTRTGGIPTLVTPDANGRMMPEDAGANDWAAAILQMLADPDAYAELRRGSHAAYRDRLNWHAWARALIADLSRQTIQAS